jgi:hypothetical protein
MRTGQQSPVSPIEMPDCEIGKLGNASKATGDSDLATKKSRMAELVLSLIQRNRTLPQENIWSSTRALPSTTRLIPSNWSRALRTSL